jgi:RNA polymerase sigma-70 factor (ECF subfamily)
MLKPTPRVKSSGAQEDKAIALRTLFDSEETPLLRYAFSLIGQRAVAEDIVQDVFLKLHKHWDEVDSPQAWLFRSVRNGVCDHIRNHRREILGSDHGATHEPDDRLESPEVTLLRGEATGTLRQLLDELDETDRQLVTLKYFEGLSYCGISSRTGLSEGNVGYRLHHILKALAAKLRPLGIDGIS